MGYCEWNGNAYLLREFPISHATHQYTQLYDYGTDAWFCNLDGSVKVTRLFSNVGFSQGQWIRDAGEAHATHVQIGKMAPDKLNLSNLKERNVSTGTWQVTVATPDVTGGPYGADEVSNGNARVWTNPH
jgi:hypothetical protein